MLTLYSRPGSAFIKLSTTTCEICRSFFNHGSFVYNYLTVNELCVPASCTRTESVRAVVSEKRVIDERFHGRLEC